MQKLRVLNPKSLYSKFSCIFLTGFSFIFSIAPSLSASYILDGKQTSKPYGHIAFCKLNPGDCQKGNPAADNTVKPDKMTAAKWTALQKVNRGINAKIKPVSDQQSSGIADIWSANAKSGDCEDYALAKRRKLISAGFSPRNLRLAMTRIPSGTAHLVLVVRTDKGDLVLDNLKSDVKAWNKTGYRFVKIQASGGSREWVSIGG